MAKEVNIDSLADKIADRLLAAKQQAREAGEDVGEEFAKGVVQGIQKHSKDFKTETTKQFEELQKITKRFKSKQSVSTADWNKAFELSKELMKSERYAKNVEEILGDVRATFSGIGEVSGIKNIVKELDKASDRLESVSWSQAGMYFKSRKKPAVEQPKTETPVVQADPAPVVKVEEKKQKAIQETTADLHDQKNAVEDAAKAQDKYNQRMSEIKDKYSADIQEQKQRISNQEAWLKYLNGSLDESKFKTTGKKAATDQLRSLTNYMVNGRRNNYANDPGQYPKEMAEVAWMRGYQEAERQGVADSVLRRFDTDARYDFDANLKKLQDEYDMRKKIMDAAYEELKRLYLERDKEAFAAFTDNLMPDGPQSDEENRILSEITEQVAKKTLSYTEAKASLEKSIITLRNMASSEAKVNLQNLVNDLKKTYDAETFDKVFGADLNMFDGFDKIDDAGAKELYDMLIESNKTYQASLVKTIDVQKEFNKQMQDGNILYHAGDLSNPSKTQKTYPLGHVRPSKSSGIFNGFTGLYTTEDVDGFWGNEWSGAPISTIDASQYKLFNARTDELATKAKEFFDSLNGTIYGYIEDFSTGEIKKATDVKSIDELWTDFQEVFKNTNMTFEKFSEFIKKAQSLVFGKNFDFVEGLPDLDEGVVKTGEKSALQGVSKEVFNLDSFQTQLLKMLGFEGIDLRGTKHNGTYTGGTVIFDVKPESIKTTNEKWSDVMASHGYEIDEDDLAREEKRRQLAFDTANAYSQQADSAKEVAAAQKSDYYEMSHKEATDYIFANYDKDLWDRWFLRGEDDARSEIAKKLENDAKLKNAALNQMWHNYKAQTESDISYDDFLNSKIPVYRGERAIDLFGNIGESITKDAASFSLDKRIAKDFAGALDSRIGAVLETYISPKDTLGMPRPKYETESNAETEVLVPMNRIADSPEYLKFKQKLKEKQDIHSSGETSEDVEKTITSYEELCGVVARYNELVKKDIHRTTDEDFEFNDLLNRISSSTENVPLLKLREALNKDGGYDVDKLAGLIDFDKIAAQQKQKDAGKQLQEFIKLSKDILPEEMSIDQQNAYANMLQKIQTEGLSAADAIQELSSALKALNGHQDILEELNDVGPNNKFREYDDTVAVGYDRIQKLQKIRDGGTTGTYSTSSLLRANRDVWDIVKDNKFFSDIPEEGAQRLDKIDEIVQSVATKMLQKVNLTESDLVSQLLNIRNATGGNFRPNGKDIAWSHFATYDDDGNKHEVQKENGITYKVYAAFENIEDLNADIVSSIMSELTKAGFEGRLKTTTGSSHLGDRTGWIASTDQLVVHGSSKKDQEIAYNVLRNMKTPLSYLGGGIDTPDGSFTQTLASDSIEKYVRMQSDARKQSEKSLQDVLDLIDKMAKESGDSNAFNKRHKALINKANDLTSGADYNQLYNQLIENEDKYQQKLQESERLRAERTKQIEEYDIGAMPILDDESIPFEDRERIFTDFANKIMQDEITASEALERLSQAMDELRAKSKDMPDDIIESFGAENEHVAEIVSQLKKLSSIDLTRIFDSVDLRSFLQAFNIDSSNFAAFRKLFEELMQITNAMYNGVDVGNAFNLKMEEITNTIMRLGGNMVDLDDGGYATMMQEFYKHMSNTKVQFNDQIKADYTKDQWRSLYGTYKNRLTSDLTKGIPADSLYHELSGLFPSLFPEGVLSQQDQFKLIFEKLDEARQLQADNWKVLQGFTSSDRNDIQLGVDNMFNQMSDALLADSSATQLNAEADALKEVEQNATKAANAKGKFAQANKKLGDSAASSSEDLDDEADSLEDVNRAAANMPDVSAYDSTQVRVDANGRPYSVSGTATTEMIDGSHVRTTDTYQFDDDNNRWEYLGSVQSTERTREMVQALEEYYQILNRIQKLRLDTSGAIHTEEINKLETDDLARAYQRVCDLGIRVNDIEGQINLSVNQRQALLDVELRARQEMYDVIAKMEDKQATAAEKPYQKTVRDELKKSADIDTNVRLLGEDGASDRLQAQIADYRRLVDELVEMRLQLARNSDLTNDVDFSNRFADTAERAERARAAIEGIFKESQKLSKLGEPVAVSTDKVSDLANLKSAMIEFANSTLDGEVKINGFNKEGNQMYVTLNNGTGAVKNITVALDDATDKLMAFSTGTSKATNEWEDFKTQAVQGAKNIIGMYVGFHEGVQAVRTGANYVKEIDLAMTELKKVTDETDASYKQFLDDAGSTSAIIGSTIRDFTEASATFARLGYSLEESSSMAETAIIYKNVADGLDTVEESSESIISTMMAFGIEANDTMSIIDRFNAVGNNFAITSAGIGDALQRSASALFAAGNTLDESVALVTAANSVIQNPEQVGTALKTLALRLRGAKTELEEAGEDVDGMAESTSQLQAKLKALTHGKVDIMLDPDTFKSTTQILREMSAAWEDMTDIERAAALELMGGKRQANILSSVITNFETVEDVITTSMNSAGSAMAENEKWLDSIEGKTYQFTNALQTMWSNMLDSEVIKGFLDFGTDAVQFLDTGAGKVIAFVAALKLAAKFKGFSIKGVVQGLGDTINKITTAQQTLQTLGKTTPIGQGFDLTNVNAYAQAVANLTAKQQANLLASHGLNQEQIRYALTLNQVDDAAMREAMAHVHAASAKQQENAVTAQSIQQKAKELAMSLRTQAATADETRQKELNVVADILENATSEEAIKNNLQEVVTSGSVSAALKAETTSTLGLDAAKKGLLATTKALMIANPVGFWLTVGTTILSLIPIVSGLVDTFTKSADEIKQEATEISQAYSDTVNEINSNLESLGITFDAKSITTLENEFTTLSAGVDRYGNNISLTSDEYERYREICEKIVGINPLIASGYDSATEAIGNNASVLSQLIGLQREQARLAAEEYVNDENLETLTDDSVNDYKDAVAELASTRSSAIAGIRSAINESYSEFVYNKPDYVDSSLDTATNQAKWILEQIGYSSEQALIQAQKYFNTDGMSGTFDSTSFFNQYYQEIKSNIDMFGAKYANDISKAFIEAESELAAAESRVDKARNGLIDTLLEVPVSSKNYSKLTSSGKNFLVDWIKSSEIFKVDGNVDEEQTKAMRETILNMMDIIVDDAKNIEYGGEKLTAQELLGKVYNLDQSSVDYEDYKNQIDSMLTAFWNTLSDEQKKEYGYENLEDFKISLGFDFVVEDDEESAMIKRYAEIKGITEDEAREYFNSLPAVVVKRLLNVDWDTVDENNVDDTISNAKVNQSNTISPKTYSILVESVESYNDILTQTSEIAADNTEVTQEYKDSLDNLGISQEEINKCFDDQLPLVVKNAKALNQLVKSANKNVAANVKLAKSNARLDYYQLVKQLGATLNGTTTLDDATRESIDSTLKQIDAVEKAIYQYQLLEDTLLGTSNAFDKFAKAQEIDELNTYGDSYVEMAQTMYDALYKTGQVGTESFWASVEALVPTEVYQGLTEDADRMKAIYDYYNKNILPSLRLKDDELTFDQDSAENFVKKGLKKGVFEGNTKNFDLVEGMNLEKAAELMEMTETQAYAFFAELDKYNVAGNENSFLSQLDDSLEGRIANITNDVEDLNRQKLALLEDGGYEKNKEAIDEINAKLVQSETELNKLGKEAYTTWQQYTQNDAVIAALSEVEDKTALLTEEGAKSLGLEWDEVKGQTVQQALDNLLAKQLKLEEPTVLTAQLAIDNIDGQIEDLKSILSDSESLEMYAKVNDLSVNKAKEQIETQIQKLEEDMVVISTTFGIELSEEQKATVQEELDAVETFKINDKEFKVIVNGTSDTIKSLQDVIDTQKKIKDQTITLTTYDTTYKQTKKWNPKTKTWDESYANGTVNINGNAFANGSLGAPKTETALVGELGPEMIVRNGRWTTVGDNGAEFTQVKKGDIIFNHKQTEQLLKNGHVTGRGKAYASGTAYSGLWNPVSPNTQQSNKPGRDFSAKGDALYGAADSLSAAADAISKSSKDASDEFREVFDWIEVRLEEINDDLNLKNAQLENKVGYKAQNKTVDQIIDISQDLYDNLISGADKYYEFANKLLAKVPAEYRKAAQDGSIAIEAFVGEVDEKTLEAIQEYREWVQKGDDLTVQAEETLTEISNLAKQAIDNISQDFENKTSLNDAQISQLEAYNTLLETDKGFESEKIYQAIINANNKNISDLKAQRDAMQSELNASVESGKIKKYSQNWYDAVNDIAEVDTQIIELKTDTEDYQDSINELHWDKFDTLMSQYEMTADEIDNLIDIIGSKDLVNKDTAEWTDEGIASIGLYAQKMEVAEMQAKKYKEEITYLNKNWKKLGYTETEYIEKLDELKNGQYDAIKLYNDTKDAIVDLNKERVDAIKEGIEKEIEAYEELINKKKEELDAEKDLHDFQKGVADQQKEIADIERKLAALSADNSASARAKRAQLEAELAKAQAELQETYYDRSISDQQDALDKELENFQEAKDKEMEGWDEYLENTNKVVADSLATVQTNTEKVYSTLLTMGEEYSLSITESLTSPWQDGENAIQSFSEKFGLSMSATVDELTKLEQEFKETMLEIEQAGVDSANSVKENMQRYTEAKNPATNNGGGSGNGDGDGHGNGSSGGISSAAGLVSSLSGNIQYGQNGSNVKKLQQALNELGYGNSGTSSVDGIFGAKTLEAVKRFQKDMGIKSDGVVGPDTKKKFKLKGYAKGTKSVNKDQWSIIEELGEELRLIPDGNGRLAYMKKGTGVVPADLTANLMEWGKLDPTNMLEQNKPQIGVSPSVVNNTTEIHIDASVGELLHVEHLEGNNPAEISKIVDKAWDKHMKELNAHVRRYTNR